MSSQNNKKKLPTQMTLTIRVFIAVYLLYMAVDMIKTEDITNPRMIIMGAAALFAVVGVVLIIWVLRTFIRGEYEGGRADISESEEEEISTDNPDESETDVV